MSYGTRHVNIIPSVFSQNPSISSQSKCHKNQTSTLPCFRLDRNKTKQNNHVTRATQKTYNRTSHVLRKEAFLLRGCFTSDRRRVLSNGSNRTSPLPCPIFFRGRSITSAVSKKPNKIPLKTSRVINLKTSQPTAVLVSVLVKQIDLQKKKGMEGKMETFSPAFRERIRETAGVRVWGSAQPWAKITVCGFASARLAPMFFVGRGKFLF